MVGDNSISPVYRQKVAARRVDTPADEAVYEIHVWDDTLEKRGIQIIYEKIPRSCFAPTRVPTYARTYKDIELLSEAEDTKESRSRLRRAQAIVGKLGKKIETQPDDDCTNYMEFFAEEAEVGGRRLADATRPIYKKIDEMLAAEGTWRDQLSTGVGYLVKFGIGMLIAKASGTVLDNDLIEWGSGFGGFGVSHILIEQGRNWWQDRQMRSLGREKFRVYAEVTAAVAVGMRQWFPDAVSIRPSVESVHDRVKRYKAGRRRDGR